MHQAIRHLLLMELIRYRFPTEAVHNSDDSDTDEYLSEDLQDLPLLYDEEVLAGRKHQATLMTRIFGWFIFLLLCVSMFIGVFDRI
ncbi:MAG: hypothetical protein Q8P67_08880 [archaeon]|nr:hypothetical protein [archaeon]